MRDKLAQSSENWTGRRLLPQRKLLHELLEQIRPKNTMVVKFSPEFPWGKIKIEPHKCSACGTCVALCPTGAISKKSGLIKNSNTQSLIGTSLNQDLEQLLKKKIPIENDANCFAKAEATMGVAKGFEIVFGVIMGTGVGGGIIINGKVHQGRTNIAGEWGHHTLHQNGNVCYCGKNGCVETYISGPALEKRWLELTGISQTVPEIIQFPEHPKYQQWKNEFLENFGLGLANVIDILDPDVIVLGGGLSNVDFLYSEGKDSVYDKVFSDLVETPILKNNLGDSAGVFGAAVLE